MEHAGQLSIIHDILHRRGLDMLEANRAQALVPDRCEVIENRLGTAPVMVFRFPENSFGATLYALPGVPFEAVGAIPDIMRDIRNHYPLEPIMHHSLMVYGLAESALSEQIAPWEDALPEEMHLAYLPHPLTGIRLRLSIYGGIREDQKKKVEEQILRLKEILGNKIYSEEDDTLEATVGRLLKGAGKTLSAPETDRERLCRFHDRSGRSGRRCVQSCRHRMDRSSRTQGDEDAEKTVPKRPETQYPAVCGRGSQFFAAYLT